MLYKDALLSFLNDMGASSEGHNIWFGYIHLDRNDCWCGVYYIGDKYKVSWLYRFCRWRWFLFRNLASNAEYPFLPPSFPPFLPLFLPSFPPLEASFLYPGDKYGQCRWSSAFQDGWPTVPSMLISVCPCLNCPYLAVDGNAEMLLFKEDVERGGSEWK